MLVEDKSTLKPSTANQRKVSDDSLDNRFSYHAPTGEKIAAHEEVRSVLGDVAKYLVAKLPPSRETSLALTKIEEGMFWANAAIARNS